VTMTDDSGRYLKRAERYREESARCRAAGKQTNSATITREYEKLADIYERLAMEAEQMHAVSLEATNPTS
jgi:hypothetical protein